MDKRSASPIEVARKVLHRRSVDELTAGSVLADAIELVLDSQGNHDDLERLAYLIVLFRQITAAVLQKEIPADSVIDLTNRVVGPALLPRGPFAILILSSLANPIKPHPLRATEALTAATRMAAALPPAASSSSSSHLLLPMFLEVRRDGLAARPNLVAINVMLESIPADLIPADLLDNLLADLHVSENANIRSAAVATLLGRRRAAASGSEQAKDKVMVSPLMPLFKEDDDNTITQVVRRYLLEPLFKTRRASFPTFLEMLSAGGDECFAAWVTVASFGVSTGLMGIDGLDLERLNEAIVHEDPRIRILAFELVAINKNVLEPAIMELVKQSLGWNQEVTQAGARTDLASAMYAFFTHLKALELATVRDAKRAKTPEATATFQKHIASANAFHKWFVNEYLEPMVADCRTMPPVRALFGLRLLQLYLDVFGDRPDVVSAVYTPELITLLIACQASEFADTRSQARRIIAQGPHPLPGYETLDVPLAKTLLASARSSINHPRNTQAEAGRAAISIVFTKLVQPLGDKPSVVFVSDLIELLESHIAKSEDNLSTGIVEFPLHGSLGVLADMIRSLDLKAADAQAVWRPVLHKLFAIVDRVWAVTRKVVSLGPTDGENGTAGHEIARAVEVLGDGDEEGGDEGLDHTNLLSACWRATREAAEVLSALVTVPLAAKQQDIWSRDDIHHAGLTFLTWMHEVRHRGTFSKIAPALGLVVDSVKRHPEFRSLVDEWLENELGTIAKGHLSTLRRSAALPYSLLAIVSSDKSLLDRAVDQLVEMARLGSGSPDTTKVHAMNCLKIVLLDAKQAKFFNHYFERTLMVALAAFGSSNWNVRNVGLILFSTMAHRSLATGHSHEVFGSRAALAGRQTLASWHSRYPSIIPHIGDYLRRARKDGPASLTEHSPLFPILIIVRSLRWSADGSQTAEYLAHFVEPYLGSVEWQVREVAAQALSSLLSPSGALEKAKVTVTRVSHETDDYNTLHGRLLFLRRLYADVVPWAEIDETDKKLLELRMRDALHVYANCKVAVIPKEILDCVNTYATVTTPVSTILVPEAKRTAAAFLHSPPGYVPGIDLLHEAAAQTALIAPSPKDVIALLTTSVPEDAQLAALERLDSTELQTTETLWALIRLCTAGAGDAVLTKAYEVLSSWPSSPLADGSIANLADHLWHAIERSRCVPLREAALEALGRAVVSATVPGERISALAERLSKASDENRSEPCRAAALGCLEHLSPLLFGARAATVNAVTLASLHQTLLRLLEDDDADIRIRASGIVSAGLGNARPVVLGKAVALWWDWLVQLVQSSLQHRLAWEGWLWETAMQRVETDSEIATLTAPAATSDILFVEEPPNMFRNALADATEAGAVLVRLGDGQGQTQAVDLINRLKLALATPAGSPIDETWEARRKLDKRDTVLRGTLSA